MKPYRDLFPHARLVLPETEHVAKSVVVLPTGPSVSLGKIEAIAAVIRTLASKAT